MIYVATKELKGNITAYYAENKKLLKEMGFKWISSYETEQNATLWTNENYMFNTKVYLY